MMVLLKVCLALNGNDDYLFPNVEDIIVFPGVVKNVCDVLYDVCPRCFKCMFEMLSGLDALEFFTFF